MVIVGYGMAGARLAEQVRARDPEGGRVALTVVGAEPWPAYNRVLLSGVLAGTMTAADIALHDPAWARGNRVRLRLGARAVRLDRAARTVRLADGASIGYDALVLATGSRPWLPPVEGLADDRGEPAEGVATLRDLDDCLRIVDQARPGVPVAVLGGGVLGVETALGLARRGAGVTLIHPADHLMERHLDRTAGMILAALCRAAGVRAVTGRAAVRYYPGEGVKLEDGAFVPAAVTVVTAGVRPETGLAADAGLAVDAGIVVDDRLRTADPLIHAIGDCARAGRAPQGLVQPAWEQAAVLADLLTGADGTARYRAGPVVTRLRAGDVDLTAFGETHLEADLTALGETHLESDSPRAEVLSYVDPARGTYAKLALADDRVIGAIVLGLPDAAATLTQLHDTGGPAPGDRPALLFGRALPQAVADDPARLPDSATVCRCNSVTKADLVRAARSVGGDLGALMGATRAATGCGDCLRTVRRLAERLEDDSGNTTEGTGT
ncbi:FAD/NAD(P)-binding oxidoreductase [Streptosporangium carneum]|uniref:FAD/NAD(P)-binding oxidoreductase n=1 Tax=Streptosporangium carneum TaxID=47481 RepID=A0A9W6MCP3_9ACTN|nr:FAD/NAD(P)-binding oxidoreductase [Streptosporangium carneum]